MGLTTRMFGMGVHEPGYYKKRREHRMSLGICRYCPKKIDKDISKTKCVACFKKESKRQKKRYTEGQEKGLCFVCAKINDRVPLKICSSCWGRESDKRKSQANQLKDIVYTHYGKYCKCCNENNFLFLSIDHVNNDGHEDRKKNTGKWVHLYKRIIKEGFPDRYQILCMNCNYGKRMNHGICPHENYRLSK